MNRIKEYKLKNIKKNKYKQNLSKLLELISYERKYVNKNLDNYYDENMSRLERAKFKKVLASYNNKVNYSRFLSNKIKHINK